MNKIHTYVEAVSEASARSRKVLLTICAVSAVFFVGFFNSWPNNFLNRQIEVAEDALILAPFTAPPTAGISAERHAKAKAYWEARRFRFPDEQSLRNHVENLRKVQLESSYILQIPVFGIAFHVRDLGIVGGITFLLLLTVFRFCLARELSNLHVALSASREDGVLRPCYRILAMKQVLLVPRTHSDVGSRYWTWLPKALFLLPALIQFFVIVVESIDLSRSFDEQVGGPFRLGVSIALFFMLAILTFSSLKLSFAMRTAWISAQEEAELIERLSLEGRWVYKMESDDGDHEHEGKCVLIARGENEFSIRGVRERSRDNIITDKELEENRRQIPWRSEWAFATADGSLIFEYTINTGPHLVRGYCSLDAHDDQRSVLKGTYYIIHPPQAQLTGMITFYRSVEESAKEPRLIEQSAIACEPDSRAPSGAQPTDAAQPPELQGASGPNETEQSENARDSSIGRLR